MEPGQADGDRTHPEEVRRYLLGPRLEPGVIPVRGRRRPVPIAGGWLRGPYPAGAAGLGGRPGGGGGQREDHGEPAAAGLQPAHVQQAGREVGEPVQGLLGGGQQVRAVVGGEAGVDVLLATRRRARLEALAGSAGGAAHHEGAPAISGRLPVR